jgi:hypothetical protein
MKQREIQDKEKVRWQCVQAFSGVETGFGKDGVQVENQNGTVTVVCTPSGGAQTVRLDLDNNWLEKMSDSALENAIADARHAAT